jgi:hypothetical protein
MKKNRTVYFLCSPNIGLMDNWLPVICRLKKMNNNFKYVLILSHSRNIPSINFDNATVRIAEDVFDFVILLSPSGIWTKVDSIKYLVKNNFTVWKLLEISLRVSNKIKLLRSVFLFLKNIVNILDKKKYKGNVVNLENIILKDDLLLYDIHTYLDPIDYQVISKFNDSYRFSMSHGISFNDSTMSSKGHINKIKLSGDNNKLKIFLFSEILGYEYYLKQYSITQENFIIAGVPRHDQVWIDKIQSLSEPIMKNFNDEASIFIASRPECNYIPRERKVKVFKDIKSFIIDQLNMKVIVKLHPKEINDRICEDIFGKEKYGKTWIYSNLHPYVLGKGKRLSIAFNSAVSFDMLRLGVPCIEYINLEGIPNMNGSTEYGRKGVVVSVNNYKDFQFQVNKLLTSPDYASNAFGKYKSFFDVIDDSSIKVASEIIEEIKLN